MMRRVSVCVADDFKDSHQITIINLINRRRCGR